MENTAEKILQHKFRNAKSTHLSDEKIDALWSGVNKTIVTSAIKGAVIEAQSIATKPAIGIGKMLVQSSAKLKLLIGAMPKIATIAIGTVAVGGVATIWVQSTNSNIQMEERTIEVEKSSVADPHKESIRFDETQPVQEVDIIPVATEPTINAEQSFANTTTAPTNSERQTSTKANTSGNGTNESITATGAQIDAVIHTEIISDANNINQETATSETIDTTTANSASVAKADTEIVYINKPVIIENTKVNIVKQRSKGKKSRTNN